MTLTIEGILSTKDDAEVSPTKPKPGLTPVEWREYHRRNYVRELRRCRNRIQCGWTESAAMHWEIRAAYELTVSSINTRIVRKGVIL